MKELHEQFKVELSALLKKYRATMEVQDFGRDWAHEERIVVDFDCIYDLEPTRPYSQLILGTYID